jgi:tetratricopeptide (TPR) repeat protein
MTLNIPYANFLDYPEPEQFINTINRWLRPALSERLKKIFREGERNSFWEISHGFKSRLAAARSERSARQLQREAVSYLYSFIRLNVKRGRVFDLREVLGSGQADCLGYAKLLTVLGRLTGLDLGVVEVIIDIRGATVPHTAVLVRLAGGQAQVIDPWYGSQDIRHRRLGARVKHGSEWNIEDIDIRGIRKFEGLSYLPDSCVDAITLYIEGNRALKKGDYSEAVRQYTRGIDLYPQNSRLFYNRAVAHENLGMVDKAQADYARALQDEASTIRTLATQPQEIVELIRLDEEHITERTQEMYLLAEGFITGKKISIPELAHRFALSPAEVTGLLCGVRAVI